MSQQRTTDSGLLPSPESVVHVRAVKPRLLSAIGAAVIMLVSALATGTAQASPSASSGTARRAAAPVVVHVFIAPHFKSSNAWLSGNHNQCTFVGGAWNDRIRSARTESASWVELWEHADCTGISIAVDRTGYGNIGPWVSAFRNL